MYLRQIRRRLPIALLLLLALALPVTLQLLSPASSEELLGRVVEVREPESFVVDIDAGGAPGAPRGQIVLRGDSASVFEGMPGSERVIGIRNAIVDDLVSYRVAVKVVTAPEAKGVYRLIRLRNRMR